MTERKPRQLSIACGDMGNQFACVDADGTMWWLDAGTGRWIELPPIPQPQGEAVEPLPVDCTKLLPGGKLDDSTYEAIEAALDRADAPLVPPGGGRYMTLVERVEAMGAELKEERDRCRGISLTAADTPSPPEPVAAGDYYLPRGLLALAKSIAETGYASPVLTESALRNAAAEITRLRAPIEVTDAAVEAARRAWNRSCGNYDEAMRVTLTAALRALGR